MKNRILITVVMLCLLLNISFGKNILYHKVLKKSQIEHIAVSGFKIATIAAQPLGKDSKYLEKEYSFRSTIDFFNGIEWQSLPFTFLTESGELDTIFYKNNRPDIEFDAQGNLWTAAIGGLFKYDGENWIKYNIEDSVNDNRKYTRLVFDSLGNIWFTSEYGINPQKKGSSTIYEGWVNEIYKYDGINYHLIFSQNEFFSGFGCDYGIMTTRNGRVIVHKITSNLQNVENDLYIFSEDGSMEIKTLPNPHKLLSDSQLGFKRVVNIFEDNNGNLWFALGDATTIYDDAGLVVMKNDGTFFAFSENNKYPLVELRGEPINKPPWKNIYYDARNIYQDSKGKIWFGSTFINIIDENNFLVNPEFDNLLDNVTLYTWNWDDDSLLPGLKVSYSTFFTEKLDSVLNDMFNQRTKNYWINGISETPDGSVWFAISGLGVLRYNNSHTFVKDMYHFKNLDSFYPNPISRDNLKITLGLENHVKSAKIKIVDVNGKNLYSEEFTYDVPSNIIQLQLPDCLLTAGFYYLIVNYCGNIECKKIIVL
jgi:hypothetical protein